MTEEILKAIPIFVFCLFKFIMGPTLGYAAGLHIITTIVVTVLGMMTSVVAFTYFGDWLRMKLLKRWMSKRKRFTPGNRQAVRIWNRFGIVGVAILTPILFTPILGTIIAVAFGSPKEKLLLYMFISASVFATLFSVAIYTFGDAVLPDFVKPNL
jgi:membrane protein DedA with SNARE-associated domain